MYTFMLIGLGAIIIAAIFIFMESLRRKEEAEEIKQSNKYIALLDAERKARIKSKQNEIS